MPKCIESKNRKRAAIQKLAKQKKFDKPFEKKSEELFSEKNKNKASSCTKQRKLKYGSPEKVKINTSHLNVLPRKEKKAAKKVLLAA